MEFSRGLFRSAGRFRCFAGREVNGLQLGGNRNRGKVDTRMHGADDETSVAALDQRAQLARAGRRAGLGVLGDEFDLAAGDAAAAMDDLDGLRRAFVVPMDRKSTRLTSSP